MSASAARVQGLALGLIVLLSCFAYGYFIAAGKAEAWPSYSHYYDDLAEGFRQGHLHLAELPSQLLMSQPNPYEPSLRPLWKWDVTLHDGKYYLYWGPVPALLLAGVKTLLGIDQPVGDELLVLVALCIRMLAGTWLLWALLRRCFPAAPGWLAPCGALLLGLAMPVPFFAARSSIYEASIAGGQAFVVAGLLLAFLAMARSERRLALLAGASACWGLAVGCRISLGLALAAVCAATCLALLYGRARTWDAWRQVLATGLPLAASVGLLGYYNYARFGSFRDFGLDEQLSTMKFTFSVAHFPANLYSYLLRSFQAQCQFPFFHVASDLHAAAFPDGFPLPSDHRAGEPVVGLLRGLPFCLLALPLLIAFVQPRLRAQLFGRSVRQVTGWLALVSGLLATLPLLPALGLWMATMRYQLDVVAALVVLGTMGSAALLSLTHGRTRWAVTLSVLALAGYSLAVGVLLGFQGYYDHFLRFNPELFRSLQELALCTA